MKVSENFNEFMMSAKLHQEPGVYKRYGANPEMKDPFHLETRPEVGEEFESEENNLDNMHDAPNKLEHSPYHMVLQNLSKIRKCLDCLETMCTSGNPEAAEELVLNHAWMVDHIATSADDLQESCDFISFRLNIPNTSREENSMQIDLSNLGESSSYEFKNIRLDRL